MKSNRQGGWPHLAETLAIALLTLAATRIKMVAQETTQSPGAAVPTVVQFTGVLRDENGKPTSSTVGVTFLLYKDQQGGAPLWLETQNVQPDKTGQYSVLLGSTSSNGLRNDIFVAGEARWLAIQAQGQREQPRVMLLSVPYALKAADAETFGGLPVSAFALASSTASGASSGVRNRSASSPLTTGAPSTSLNVTTTGGTVSAVPLWTTATNIQSSAISQNGSGATVKIGVNTTLPSATLDVNGSENVRGLFTLPATGAATASAGKNSQAQDFVASVFNSSTATAVPQKFQWQAEPAANNSANASGTLNLLYAPGTAASAETGLKISNKGVLTFAPGQTFPGAGTITGVNTQPGSGLAGGGTTGTLNLSIPTAGVTDAMLKNSAVTLVPGPGLTGGGLVSLGGSTSLSVDTTKIPQLATSNTFTGNQTVNGNLSATGMLTGSAFQIGSNLFAFGSFSNNNAFLGFAGSMTTTGDEDTATGALALASNTSGFENTAIGSRALEQNLTGGDNTATGAFALQNNATGNNNTAVGRNALAGIGSGSNNTAIGDQAGNSGDSCNSSDTFVGFSAGTAVPNGTPLSNATAIGANAEVDQNDSLVLGSINGVNNATANTNVGIGTTAPQTLLHVDHVPPTTNGMDVVEITSGGSTLIASLLLQNTGQGGQHLREGAGTAAGYLASSGGLSFITNDTGTPNNPSGAIMSMDTSGNVIIPGNLSIGGSISKNGGSFKIDHPLDPANKYLYHSFVESPDMMNLYNGVVTLNANGSAWITMPDYFEALNREFRYQLTSIGRPQPSLYVAREISGNRFKIGGGKPSGKVSWQVTGIRHDAWADAHRIPVEVDKPPQERGTYSHPELFGAVQEGHTQD